MKYARVVGLLAFMLLPCVFTSVVNALSSSTNYKVDEVQFGAGAGTGSSSTYKAQESVGDAVAGFTSSANYKAYTGFLKPGEEFLEMDVTGSSLDLGTLSTTTTAAGTSAFSIRAYLDSGYSVYTLSLPPTQEDGHSLTPMSTLATPTAGTEQFGINLARNTTFCPIACPWGSAPVQMPDSSFATGDTVGGYNTDSQFKYNWGDKIATTSGSGWGQTNYTISYVVNISGLTRAGKYVMTQDLLVVAQY